MATEKITIQIGDEVIELKGAEKQAFIDDRDKTNAEILAKETEQKELKVSAYTKLGLTEEEINAIL